MFGEGFVNFIALCVGNYRVGMKRLRGVGGYGVSI